MTLSHIQPRQLTLIISIISISIINSSSIQCWSCIINMLASIRCIRTCSSSRVTRAAEHLQTVINTVTDSLPPPHPHHHPGRDSSLQPVTVTLHPPVVTDRAGAGERALCRNYSLISFYLVIHLIL